MRSYWPFWIILSGTKIPNFKNSYRNFTENMYNFIVSLVSVEGLTPLAAGTGMTKFWCHICIRRHLKPKQKGWNFADTIVIYFLLLHWYSNKIIHIWPTFHWSFVLKDPNDNKSTLFVVTTWHWKGDCLIFACNYFVKGSRATDYVKTLATLGFWLQHSPCSLGCWMNNTLTARSLSPNPCPTSMVILGHGCIHISHIITSN